MSYSEALSPNVYLLSTLTVADATLTKQVSQTTSPFDRGSRRKRQLIETRATKPAQTQDYPQSVNTSPPRFRSRKATYEGDKYTVFLDLVADVVAIGATYVGTGHVPFTGGFEAIVTSLLSSARDTVMQPVAWVIQTVGRDVAVAFAVAVAVGAT